MSRRSGLRIDANFTEDTVGFALESFLSILSFPRLRFSIEPFSRSRERWLGADGRLHGGIRGFRPFYMQFKRPAAFPDFSNARVIQQRKSLGLPVSPQSLFFQLRDKQPSHSEYQHNILLRLRQRLLKRNLGDAAYVCPLFLDRSAYRMHVHLAGLFRWPRFWRHDPWELEELLINHSGTTVSFDRIPVLAEHISIPPHDTISNAKHCYSFTDQGTDVCFHSPLGLPDSASTLGNFLAGVAKAFQADGGKIRIDDANNVLRELVASEELELLPNEKSFATHDDPIANWHNFGETLSTLYAIEQFAFVAWQDR